MVATEGRIESEQSLADWVAEHYGPEDVDLLDLYRAYYERARANWHRRARKAA